MSDIFILFFVLYFFFFFFLVWFGCLLCFVLFYFILFFVVVVVCCCFLVLFVFFFFVFFFFFLFFVVFFFLGGGGGGGEREKGVAQYVLGIKSTEELTKRYLYQNYLVFPILFGIEVSTLSLVVNLIIFQFLCLVLTLVRSFSVTENNIAWVFP